MSPLVLTERAANPRRKAPPFVPPHVLASNVDVDREVDTGDTIGTQRHRGASAALLNRKVERSIPPSPTAPNPATFATARRAMAAFLRFPMTMTRRAGQAHQTKAQVRSGSGCFPPGEGV